MTKCGQCEAGIVPVSIVKVRAIMAALVSSAHGQEGSFHGGHEMRYRDFLCRFEQKPAIVAHRGYWQKAPENSLAAIDAAIASGFDIVEIDVQRSEDNVFFLMHDEMLTRMTGTEFPCNQLSIAQLQVMPLRNGQGGSGAGFSHDAIPTLAEALKLAKGRVFLDLDVKHNEDLPKVAKLVAEMGMQDEAAIKINVQSEEDAHYLTALEDEHGVMVMPKTRFDAKNCKTMINLLQNTGANVVEARFDSLYTLVSHRSAFADAAIAIWVNTLDPVACCGFSDSAALRDPDAIWGSLIEAGVALIQTDQPEMLADWRQKQRTGFPDQASIAALQSSVPST